MLHRKGLWRDIPITADELRLLGEDELEGYLKELNEAQLDEIMNTYEFWARESQLEPVGKDWDYWIYSAGRGAGKTFAGSNWGRHRIKMGDSHIACVAPTKGDVRRVMVEGDSGLLNVCWKGDRTYRGGAMGYPVWSPTNNTMTWGNGSKATFYSAEDPDRLRGPNHFSSWCDEVSSWRNQQEVWDMLQLTLRKGRHPRVMVTTTPKPTKLMRTLLSHKRSHITGGSTFDNAANLAPTFLEAVKSTYEGTRLGRQELYAEMLEEAEGALWTTDVLDAALDETIEDRVDFAKTLQRVVISIDPAITSNEESDLTGIIVAGIDINGTGYILEDHTGRYTPQGWAAKAISLYHEFSADRIVAEKNQGGDMVRTTLTSEDESVPIRLVHASRGKFARAEPVSALYERGKVKHAKGLDDLEVQMRTWEPLGSIGSPDRLDAMVWALTDLMLKGTARPQLRLAYSSAKGLT
jgi:phage terminase large subunit-like protein